LSPGVAYPGGMGCGCEAARATRSNESAVRLQVRPSTYRGEKGFSVRGVVYDEGGFERWRPRIFVRTKQAAYAIVEEYKTFARGGASRIGSAPDDMRRRIDAIVRNEPSGNAARYVPDVVTKAKAADKKYGYFRPDDQFTIDAIHLSEAERKKLADRIFDKADDPYVSMSLGKLIVAPSQHSYFGDELFVAVKESIKRPYRFEASGNRFVIL